MFRSPIKQLLALFVYFIWLSLSVTLLILATINFFDNNEAIQFQRAWHMPKQADRGPGPMPARSYHSGAGAHKPSKCAQFKRPALSRHRRPASRTIGSWTRRWSREQENSQSSSLSSNNWKGASVYFAALSIIARLCSRAPQRRSMRSSSSHLSDWSSTIWLSLAVTLCSRARALSLHVVDDATMLRVGIECTLIAFALTLRSGCLSLVTGLDLGQPATAWAKCLLPDSF